MKTEQIQNGYQHMIVIKSRQMGMSTYHIIQSYNQQLKEISKAMGIPIMTSTQRKLKITSQAMDIILSKGMEI